MIRGINLFICIPMLFILYLTPFIFADEIEPGEEALKQLENVLKVELEVKLIQPGELNAWNAKKIKYTIPGYSVLLRVEGTNIKFHGNFTPYIRKTKLFLLVQAQVWLSDPVHKSFRYFTCVKSISLTYGEKVVFLPLGVTKSNTENDVWNIEIEILITPYSQKKEEVQD